MLPPGTLFNEADKIISALNVEYIDEIREKFCNDLLDAIFDYSGGNTIEIFCKNAKLLPDSRKYHK